MARRMYDLDNGTENIKVKEIVADNFTAGSGRVVFDFDDSIFSLKMTNPTGGGFRIDDDEVEITGDPVTICGDVILMDGTFALQQYTTALRPTAYEGTIIYDSTLKKCILYNGTAWVNLDGTALS